MVLHLLFYLNTFLEFESENDHIAERNYNSIFYHFDNFLYIS